MKIIIQELEVYFDRKNIKLVLFLGELLFSFLVVEQNMLIKEKDRALKVKYARKCYFLAN